jgi:hypothetical protein
MDGSADGVWIEQHPGGFRLRASCLDFSNAVVRVGLAGVVSCLPFVLWWDLIRGVWSDSGISFWTTLVFLSIWAAAIAYTDAIALVSVFGEIRIVKDGDAGEIFTGIGKLGRTHRFRWSEFQGSSEMESQFDANGRTARTRYIVLAGPSRRYKFAWLLPDDRRDFVAAALRDHAFQ